MCGTSQGGDTAQDVGHTGGARLQQSAGHDPAVGQEGFVGAGFRTRGRREVMELHGAREPVLAQPPLTWP